MATRDAFPPKPGTGQPEGSMGMMLRILDVGTVPLPDNQTGLILKTTRGDISCILHLKEGSAGAVVWVGGAIGGLRGPGDGIYAVLGEEFVGEGFTSLRLDYRLPNSIPECVLDVLAGVHFLKGIGNKHVALVGVSFGGAVVITAGAMSPTVCAVVALSSQSAGADLAGELSPRPLLLVHGDADERIPLRAAELIYDWAQEPKELVVMPGAGHSLRQCKDELYVLLKRWLPEKLRAAELMPPMGEQQGQKNLQ